jgi:glycosyltransferase involved in cell wall biosynthesis
LNIHGPRVLALVSCDLCGKREVPPHAEHQTTGCEIWRVLQPMAELQRRGYGKAPGFKMTGAEWEWKDSVLLEQNVDVLAYWFDAIILPRLSWSDHRIGKRFIDALHRVGLCVIHETDDELYGPGISERIQQTTEPDQTLEQLEQKRLDRLAALRLCDGVTVSSRRLQTVVSTYYDGPVEVVANAIDSRWFRSVVKHARREVPGLTIGWAGGARPVQDLEPMAKAWGQVAQRRPDVTFVVAGHQPEIITEYVPAYRVRRLSWLPTQFYPMNLAQIDIACCSVSNEPFNRAKTPIKVWESTLAGSAVIASEALYGQVIDNGVDGLLANTADEWEDALLRLVDDAALRRSLRKAQRRRIAEHHTIEKNAHRWPRAWGRIVAQFQAQHPRPKLIAVGA